MSDLASRTLTPAEVIRLGPCYEDDEVRDCYADREQFTLLEIADLDIPAADRVWVLLQPTVLPDPLRRWIGCDVADHVAHLNTDPRVAACIAVTRRHILCAATDTKVRKARAAATQRMARCEVIAGAVIEFRELPGEAGRGERGDGTSTN